MNTTERLTMAFQDSLETTKNPADDWVSVGRSFLAEAIDHMEWLEKGIEEWRSAAARSAIQTRTSEARAKIAISHLQAVLNKARTHDEQFAADAAARLWLESIGLEPD